MVGIREELSLEGEEKLRNKVEKWDYQLIEKAMLCWGFFYFTAYIQYILFLTKSSGCFTNPEQFSAKPNLNLATEKLLCWLLPPNSADPASEPLNPVVWLVGLSYWKDLLTGLWFPLIDFQASVLRHIYYQEALSSANNKKKTWGNQPSKGKNSTELF